ncbi:MAG: hypothetical protein AAFX55_15525 [Bacteroidota bacterium]
MAFSKYVKHLIAFLSLTILMGTSHEFAHHFSAAMVCGCFGEKTFNSFSLCPGCQENNPLWILPTYIGPLFTFAMMWVGFFKLKKGSIIQKYLGFALIMANFPVNRILFALMGVNDEQFASGILFGFDNTIAFWLTNLGIWLFTIPPLWLCFRSINSKRKILWFLGYFILPFVFVYLFAGLFLEEWLLLETQFLANAILGIPYLLLIVEVMALFGYLLFRKYIYKYPYLKLN